MQKILLVIVLSLSSSLLFAQEGVKIGLRFSPIVSFANIIDDSTSTAVDGLSSKVGLSYGLMLNYGIGDNFGFHTGIHIVTKGFKRTLGTISSPDSIGDITGATQNVRMTTVEIPIAVKGLSKEISNGIHITGKFGVSVDITAGYKNEYTKYDPVLGTRVTEGTKNGGEFLTPVNLSFIFGPGVEIVRDFGTINAGIVLHRGLTNMNSKDRFIRQETIRVSYVSLDLGYYF